MTGRVKFTIYYRCGGRLVDLYRINRTPSGLYFSPRHDPMAARMTRAGPPGPSDGGFTYHESGRSWSKMGGDRSGMKRRDVPLSDFVGARTIGVSVHQVMRAPLYPLEADVKLRPSDIVINDRPGPVGVEIILSDRALTLDFDPSRVNSTVRTFDEVFPVIIVEVFDLPRQDDGGMFPSARFPRIEPLVEGETVFFDHHGRI